MEDIHNSTEREKKAKGSNKKTAKIRATIGQSGPTSAHKKRIVKKYYQTGIRIPKVPEQGLLIMRYKRPIMISFD